MKRLPILALFLAVAHACFPASRESADPTNNGGKSEIADASSKQPPSPNVTANPKQENRPTLANQAQKKTDKDGWDVAAVVSNILLVIVGIGGIGVALFTLRKLERQTKATEDQIKIAQQTLILTQKPKIAVRTFYFSEPRGVGGIGYVPKKIENESFCTGQFYIANVGGTAATVKEIVSKVYLGRVDHLPARRPYEGEIGSLEEKVIQAGESSTYLFGLPQPLDTTQANSLQSSYTMLCVLGWIGYTDGLGIYRRTHFCRKYDQRKDRFVVVEDTDYENAE
jgi:hypothetical protein